MKKIEINSLTLIADNNDNIIGGYGFCDDDSAKPVIDKLIAEVVKKATAPKSPTYPACPHITCTWEPEEEEEPCASCMEDDCAGCEWETCPECGGELTEEGVGRYHTLVQCLDCGWEEVR
jgi:hypothetical protein